MSKCPTCFSLSSRLSGLNTKLNTLFLWVLLLVRLGHCGAQIFVGHRIRRRPCFVSVRVNSWIVSALKSLSTKPHEITRKGFNIEQITPSFMIHLLLNLLSLDDKLKRIEHPNLLLAQNSRVLSGREQCEDCLGQLASFRQQ